MVYDRFMIAPLESGLTEDVRPWLIPDDAFSELNNAYVFRGRVRKRFGSYLMSGDVSDSVAQLYSRLRIQVGTIDSPTNPPGIVFGIGQMISAGSQMFTVWQLGTPADMLATGPGTGTFNTTTGAFVLTGAGLPGNTPIYFYPATPVMGIVTYEVQGTFNNETTYAFDTQFAYYRVNDGWDRLGTAIWTGNDSNFFWGYTYRGANLSNNLLFVSNYNYGTNLNNSDVMKYWDGANWNNFNPVYTSITSTNTIVTARLIIPFKDRLVLMNIVENTGINPGTNIVYGNRIRFSQNGSPVASNAWYDDVAGLGGYLDAPTQEQIITADFIKDRLIVFFESSTWELVYTGNEILPFRWQQINTELGAESTFSVVPFDKVILGIGNVGIHACNGANVERIDQKIPNEVFDIHNLNEGVLRVNGIRDYFVEMVYWAFPASEGNVGEFNDTYPNRVLVYNYRTGSWAFNDDSITFFGYYLNPDDITWNSTNKTWEEYVDAWNLGALTAKFRQILAGNQEGFTFVIDPDANSRNAPALQITNITYTPLVYPLTITVVNHNLTNTDYVYVENVQGVSLNAIYPVTVVDSNTITIPESISSGTYTGGGTLARVSRIDIYTKQYNFYNKDNRNCYIPKVDFMVDATQDGAITVDFFTSSSTESLVTSGTATGSQIGNNVLETSPYPLYPYEATQARLWHPVYLQADGECVQLRIYLSDDQMTDVDIVQSDFELHAMTFYATKTSSRMQ